MKNLQKLFDLLSKIQHDKLLHGFYGMVVFVLVVGLIGCVNAALVVTGVALLKEVLDIKGSGFDVKDIVATVGLPWVLVLVL